MVYLCVAHYCKLNVLDCGRIAEPHRPKPAPRIPSLQAQAERLQRLKNRTISELQIGSSDYYLVTERLQIFHLLNLLSAYRLEQYCIPSCAQPVEVASPPKQGMSKLLTQKLDNRFVFGS